MIENLEKASIVESVALRLRQQFFSHVGTIFCLPGLNQHSAGYCYAHGDRDTTQCHMWVSNQRPFDNLLRSSPRALSAYVAMYELFYVFSLYCACREMNKK